MMHVFTFARFGNGAMILMEQKRGWPCPIYRAFIVLGPLPVITEGIANENAQAD